MNEPMDKTFTHESGLLESIVRNALKNEFTHQPSVSSLEFIRNFARNFRVRKDLEGDIREMILN